MYSIPRQYVLFLTKKPERYGIFFGVSFGKGWRKLRNNPFFLDMSMEKNAKESTKTWAVFGESSPMSHPDEGSTDSCEEVHIFYKLQKKAEGAWETPITAAEVVLYEVVRGQFEQAQLCHFYWYKKKKCEFMAVLLTTEGSKDYVFEVMASKLRPLTLNDVITIEGYPDPLATDSYQAWYREYYESSDAAGGLFDELEKVSKPPPISNSTGPKKPGGPKSKNPKPPVIKDKKVKKEDIIQFSDEELDNLKDESTDLDEDTGPGSDYESDHQEKPKVKVPAKSQLHKKKVKERDETEKKRKRKGGDKKEVSESDEHHSGSERDDHYHEKKRTSTSTAPYGRVPRSSDPRSRHKEKEHYKRESSDKRKYRGLKNKIRDKQLDDAMKVIRDLRAELSIRKVDQGVLDISPDEEDTVKRGRPINRAPQLLAAVNDIFDSAERRRQDEVFRVQQQLERERAAAEKSQFLIRFGTNFF